MPWSIPISLSETDPLHDLPFLGSLNLVSLYLVPRMLSFSTRAVGPQKAGLKGMLKRGRGMNRFNNTISETKLGGPLDISRPRLVVLCLFRRLVDCQIRINLFCFLCLPSLTELNFWNFTYVAFTNM